MTTQPTNHRADQYRADAEYCLRQANIHLQEGDVAAHTQTGILAALCGIYDLLAELRGADPAETDDTVEQKLFGLDHIDDHGAGVGSVGEVASRFGSGYNPGPWGAA